MKWIYGLSAFVALWLTSNVEYGFIAVGVSVHMVHNCILVDIIFSFLCVRQEDLFGKCESLNPGGMETTIEVVLQKYERMAEECREKLEMY